MSNNEYDASQHEGEPLLCPRERCRRRNAPPESDDFSPTCWKCNTYLNVSPVEHGEELEVTIEDIHESGAGVGRTEDGFVVMVHGILPEARARVRISELKPTYANAELIERLPYEPEEETEDDEDGDEEDDDIYDEDDGGPALGNRSNYWGS